MIKRKVIAVEVQFTEKLLATASGNPEIHQEFIASRAAEFKGERTATEAAELEKEEVETIPVPEQIEKASTVFHKDEAGLFAFDYTWRGYVKEWVNAMIELGQFEKLNPWNFKKACDGALFVSPRRIRYFRDGNIITAPDGTEQRPLRAQTMQGERVALARSEYINPGAVQSFDITLLVSDKKKSAWFELTDETVKTCFEMGTLKGTGQWRSGGHGLFKLTKWMVNGD